MHVVIIGNGVAGITTARHLRKRDSRCRITVVSGETDHHYSRPALMYVFMGHMRFEDTKPYEDGFWRKNRIDLLRDWVTGVNTEAKVISFVDRPPLHYDKLVIATGSQPNRFGWPGEDLEGVQGFYGVRDVEALEGAMPLTRRVVIVGGGLIGIELAEMVLGRRKEVTFLVRETSYWNNVLPAEESRMVSRLARAHGVDLRLETELTEIHGDGGRACAVTTSAGDRVACELVGLTAGVRPNVGLARRAGIPCGRGVLVDHGLRTEVPDVFAVGDCAEIETTAGERNLIQQVWYTGKRQGEVLGAVLAGEEAEYDPGIWYNSAKFFDVEYQVYGTVPAEVDPRDDVRHLYWEHASGDKAIRIVVNGADEVVGFNVMGIRFRHRLCERWIAEAASLGDVLRDLRRANFDPELYTRYEVQAAAAMRRSA